MKKTYINPSMMVVPFVATQVIAYSVDSVTGLDGVTKGEGDFEGGVVDVKTYNINIWDEEW
jgi:hypothetical protein